MLKKLPTVSFNMKKRGGVAPSAPPPLNPPMTTDKGYITESNTTYSGTTHGVPQRKKENKNWNLIFKTMNDQALEYLKGQFKAQAHTTEFFKIYFLLIWGAVVESAFSIRHQRH